MHSIEDQVRANTCEIKLDLPCSIQAIHWLIKAMATISNYILSII